MGFTATVGVRVARAAEAPTTARTQLEPILSAAERLAVPDLIRGNALRVRGGAGQAASGRARRESSEHVDVAVVATRAGRIVVAAEGGAVSVEVALAARHAAKPRCSVAVTCAVDATRAKPTWLSWEIVWLTERDVLPVGIHRVTRAAPSTSAVLVQQTGGDAAPVDAVHLTIALRTIVVALANSRAVVG